MRFDSCPSDTCPPISSQTAQGVHVPNDSISLFTRKREGGDQLEKNYCQQSPRRMLSYCIPPFLPSSNRKYFQKRWESLKWLDSTIQLSHQCRIVNCARDGEYNAAVPYNISPYTNTTLAGTEARRESDLVKNKLNLPNLWGLIQLLKICPYPVKAITSDTIFCEEGKNTISGLTEQWWLLDCSSVCSAG